MTNWEKIENTTKLNYSVAFVLPKDVFKVLKAAIKTATKKANTSLIGHVQKEYFIEKIDSKFLKFLLVDCLSHPKVKSHSDKLNYLSRSCKYYLHELWVNYQKKHEFNPPHTHAGIFSFVIFVSIPYDLKKEEKMFPDIKQGNAEGFNNNKNCTSKFAFLNTGSDGEIICSTVDVDKSFEGKMLLFPSKQMHCVFPFFTSNKYRITVSGNIKLNVENTI